MLGIIVQARLGSTRFPKKILKPFGEDTLLLYLINRLKLLNIPIVVATTTNEIDNELCEYLKENNVKYFRGNENDVLQRYIDTANKFGFTEIIRVCSDSPLVDLDFLRELLIKWKEEPVDYLSYSYKGIPTVLCHYGVFTEFTKLNALIEVKNRFENESYYHEHVTYGIYKNPNIFKVKYIELPEKFEKYNDIRITIDTKEDYENILHLFDTIDNINDCGFSELADLILNDSILLKRMKNNISNNKKV